MIAVTVELDAAPRELAAPGDLVSALDRHPAARRAFEALSFSRRQHHVLHVDGAKTAATRERRIANAVGRLSQAG